MHNSFLLSLNFSAFSFLTLSNQQALWDFIFLTPRITFISLYELTMDFEGYADLRLVCVCVCVKEIEAFVFNFKPLLLAFTAGFFEMKMKYDESDNILIRASRAVTDKMTDIIGERPLVGCSLH